MFLLDKKLILAASGISVGILKMSQRNGGLAICYLSCVEEVDGVVDERGNTWNVLSIGKAIYRRCVENRKCCRY